MFFTNFWQKKLVGYHKMLFLYLHPTDFILHGIQKVFKLHTLMIKGSNNEEALYLAEDDKEKYCN